MTRFFSKLGRVRLADVLSALPFLIALPLAHALRRSRPHIWLVCERKGEARDNGYWLYRYLCTEQPEIDVVYAIDPDSPDYHKVAQFGRQVIPWGGVRHWTYYLAAENNISSQKDGKPNAALCYLLEVYGLRKNRRVFLQHGVICNDTEFLHYDNTKMGLFVCGASPEYEYVRKAFGYPEGAVRYLGLARFDGLYDYHTEPVVLVMPSWRRNIASPTHFSKHLDTPKQFVETAYYQAWHGLLADRDLKRTLHEHHVRLAFYPHPNMQRFLELFRDGCDDVELLDWKTHDVQDLLRRAAFLVTDYSSVAMDFAYMGKPLLYYQFDMNDFRSSQYAEGYFSYERDGFGPVCTSLEEVKVAIEESLGRGLTNQSIYRRKAKQFFELHDQNNCKRNFEAIRDWKAGDHA